MKESQPVQEFIAEQLQKKKYKKKSMPAVEGQTIKVTFTYDDEILKRTIASMLYYNEPRKGKMTLKKVQEVLYELLHDKGHVGTKYYLKEYRFDEYDHRAQLKFKELSK